MKMRDFKILGVPTGWKSNVPERVNPEKQVAIAGTQVTCPKCRDVIGRLSVPMYSGMRIPAAAIEFAKHQRREGGKTDGSSKAECRTCGTAYMKHQFGGPLGLMTVIHTPLGWI